MLVDSFRHGYRRPDRYQAEFPQVGEEDADDAKREVDVGGYVRDSGRSTCQSQHADVFRAEYRRVGDPRVRADDSGDEVKGFA